MYDIYAGDIIIQSELNHIIIALDCGNYNESIQSYYVLDNSKWLFNLFKKRDNYTQEVVPCKLINILYGIDLTR